MLASSGQMQECKHTLTSAGTFASEWRIDQKAVAQCAECTLPAAEESNLRVSESERKLWPVMARFWPHLANFDLCAARVVEYYY